MLLIVSCLILSASFALAANLASDDASNYGGGWNDGSNGGSGFGAWSFVNTAPGGQFTATSLQNGNGVDGPTIDVGGVSWGMWANSGGLSSAQRALTGGSLSVGQQFKMSMDIGYIENGSSVGFGFRNSNGDDLFQFYYVGFGGWNINEFGGPQQVSSAYTNGGFQTAFTLTGSTTFTFQVVGLGGLNTTSTYTGSLLSPAAGQGITEVRLFNNNSAQGNSGAPWDQFFNSMAVIPEPTSMALLGMAFAGLLIWRIRR